MIHFKNIPKISYNGGDINITPAMNGGNTKITGITVTTGGSGFTSAPTLEFSGTGHALTFTNGVITGITLPV